MDAIQEFTSTEEGMRLFQRERLEVELTELICESMEAKGVTRAQLARRLETSRAHITQMLRDGSNMTIRSIADVFTALGLSLRLVPRQLSVSTHPLVVLEAPVTVVRPSGAAVAISSNLGYTFNAGDHTSIVGPTSGKLPPNRDAA